MRSELALRFLPRSLYLFAAAFAVVAILAWGRLLSGSGWSGQFEPLAWHQHEMVFGFSLAVLAGWLLAEGRAGGHGGGARSVPWITGLAALWLSARILLFTGPTLAAGVVDVAFVLAVAMFAWRQQPSRATAWRVAALLAMAAADVAFFLEQAAMLSVPRGKPALAAFYMTVLLASFAPQVRVTRLVIGATLLTALAFVSALADWASGTAVLALAAGLLQLLALLRSPRPGTPEQRWSFALAHLWLVAGLGLLCLEAIQPPWGATATHALGFGMIGGIALTLLPGHGDGHGARAFMRPVLIVLLHAGVLARVIGGFISPLEPAHAWLLSGSALAWAGAFAIWLAVFGFERKRGA